FKPSPSLSLSYGFTSCTHHIVWHLVFVIDPLRVLQERGSAAATIETSAMAKRGRARPLPAPSNRVQRKIRIKSNDPVPATKRSRRQSQSCSLSSDFAVKLKIQPLSPRAERAKKRAEKKTLLQQLAESKRRANWAETRMAAAEKELGDAERRAKVAEIERDELLADQAALYDEGTEVWQNVWVQQDVSSVLSFPTNKCVVSDSIERQYSGNCMPGVHAKGTIDRGRTTQSVWIKGAGYTLVGLVTSDEEKKALCHNAGRGLKKLPFMTCIYSTDDDDRKVDAFTIEVDMTERRAELYVSRNASSRLIKPHAVWENLPGKVWVAVAFKRNSRREAILAPCIHWKMTTNT
ncbi:hypothetical protein ACHAWF_009901, partial [Thalassiosira exigua]